VKFWVALAVAAGIAVGAVADTVEQRESVILEDDPRWDCTSMGNKICGKSTKYEEDE
jgi:hypothetical protein